MRKERSSEALHDPHSEMRKEAKKCVSVLAEGYWEKYLTTHGT